MGYFGGGPAHFGFGNYDENEHTGLPVLTYAIILAWIAGCFWLHVNPKDLLGQQNALKLHAFFVDAGQTSDYATLSQHALVSLFLYASPYVLAINVFYLWVFGDNVEYAMGHVRFFLFYVLCGFVSLWLTLAVFDGTTAVPLSGGIASLGAIIGAYNRFFPKVRFNLYRNSFLIPYARVQWAQVGVVTYSTYWFVLCWIASWALTGLVGGLTFAFLQLSSVGIGYALAGLFQDRSISLQDRRDIIARRDLMKHTSYVTSPPKSDDKISVSDDVTTF